MLDFDLAMLYGVETKRLKEAVRRNLERFEGEDFMMELTPDEIKEFSRTQIAALNKGRGFNIKYAPFAFTELGVAMLSSVLNSPKAIEINRNIMRAFVRIREYLLLHPSEDLAELKRQIRELQEDIKSLEKDHEDYEQHFDDIYLALAQLAATNKEQQRVKRRPIGFVKPEE